VRAALRCAKNDLDTKHLVTLELKRRWLSGQPEGPVRRIDLDLDAKRRRHGVRNLERAPRDVSDVEGPEVARSRREVDPRGRFAADADGQSQENDVNAKRRSAGHRADSVLHLTTMTTMSRIVVAAVCVHLGACAPDPAEEPPPPETAPGEDEDEAGVLNGDYEISDEATLAGLVGYSRITGSLIVESSLVSLPGLEGLRRIDQDMIIRNNENLADVDGLSGLAVVGTVDVRNNASLPSLSGLSGLAAVSADVTVEANPALTSVGGVNALRSIGGALVVADNPALVGIAGLDALEEIASTFWISGNATLAALDGFDRLTHVDEFLVFENAALPTCAIEALQAQLEVEGASYIHGNAPCP